MGATGAGGGVHAGEYLVAGFAQRAPILLVESLPSQLATAGATGETLGVVLPLHGLNSQLSRGHRLVTETTDIWGRGDGGGQQAQEGSIQSPPGI